MILFLVYYLHVINKHKTFKEELEEALIHFTQEYCGKEVEIKKIQYFWHWMSGGFSWDATNDLNEQYSGEYSNQGAVVLLSNPCILATERVNNFILNREEKRFYIDESNSSGTSTSLPQGWKKYDPSPRIEDIEFLLKCLSIVYFIFMGSLCLVYWIVRIRKKYRGG